MGVRHSPECISKDGVEILQVVVVLARSHLRFRSSEKVKTRYLAEKRWPSVDRFTVHALHKFME